MEIKRDWDIQFDEERLIAVQGQALVRLLERPGKREQFQEMLQEIEGLIQPAACWDSFPIKKILHDRLLLEDGSKIGGGPVVSVVGGASQLIAAVCTIGPAADHRVQAYQKEKQLIKAMMLSDLASWAVDSVRQDLCHWLEQEAHKQGRRVSTSLSPGKSVWSVKDQAVIFSLLDTDQIGVSLKPSMMMDPIKSLSLIMGTGTQPMGVEGGSNCDFCTLKERCKYREARGLEGASA